MAKARKDPAPAAAVAETDYTAYASKPATDLQSRFADWLVEKVGVEFSTKKEMDAFREGVRLGVALRIPFQASPENQSARAERATEPAEKPAKATKAAKAATPVKATKAAPSVPDPDDADQAEPAKPVKKAGRRAPTSTTAAAAAGKKAVPF